MYMYWKSTLLHNTNLHTKYQFLYYNINQMKDKQLSRMQLTDLIKKSLRGSTMTEFIAAALKHVSCVTALIDMVSEQDKIFMTWKQKWMSWDSDVLQEGTKEIGQIFTKTIREELKQTSFL